MANLARPVNMLPPTVERIIEFKGLNRRTTVQEGEMSDMLNLSSDDYPVLTQRKPRGRMNLPSGAVRPVQLMSRYGRIAMIATTSNSYGFFYDGELISEVTGLTDSSKMVAINNRICFFPDKTSIDVTKEGLQSGTFRSLEASVTLASDTTITMSTADARITLPSGHGFKYDDAARTLEICDREGSFPGMLGTRRFNVVLVTPQNGRGYAQPVKGIEVEYAGEALEVNL